MNILQKKCDDTIENFLGFPAVYTKFIQNRLALSGITLTDKQIKEIEKKLRNTSGDSVKLSVIFDKKQTKALGISDCRTVEINNIGEKDFDEFSQEYLNNYVEKNPELIEELAETFMIDLMDNRNR